MKCNFVEAKHLGCYSLPADPKGKATKKLATRKRKYPDVDTAIAAVVAEVVERAKRGGARSGVVIAYQLPPATRDALEQVECHHGDLAGTVMVGGQRVAINETQSQGEPQQQAQPTEQSEGTQPTEQTQEVEQTEETKQAPQPQL